MGLGFMPAGPEEVAAPSLWVDLPDGKLKAVSNPEGMFF
jgi:hypothetical protein